jgi:hypothetical protein
MDIEYIKTKTERRAYEYLSRRYPPDNIFYNRRGVPDFIIISSDEIDDNSVTGYEVKYIHFFCSKTPTLFLTERQFEDIICGNYTLLVYGNGTSIYPIATIPARMLHEGEYKEFNVRIGKGTNKTKEQRNPKKSELKI